MKHFRSCIFAALVLTMGMSPLMHLQAAGGGSDDEPDDRLPRRDLRLIAGLVRRGMPELVEEMLKNRPLMHQVYVARAYVQAGIHEKVPALRESFFVKAARTYRRVLSLGRNAQWRRGNRRRYHLAEWNVEFGDMILRYWIAADLDRFEITSGLAFNRDRLLKRLKEAGKSYARAGKVLKKLEFNLQTDEERFLLLGIADKITNTSSRRKLNAAWTDLYFALVSEPEAPGRSVLLNQALDTFQVSSQSSEGVQQKYHALLGVGMASRELSRYDEAVSIFDRVIKSTAPPALIARAYYEKARSLIAAKEFDRARMALQQLSQQPTQHIADDQAGALFYIHIAPLIHGYSYLRESEMTTLSESRRKALQEAAQSELMALIDQGGMWPKMARVYLDAVAGFKRDLDQFTDSEVLLEANRMLAGKDYDTSASAWRVLLHRPTAHSHHHAARLNLGVCLFQMHNLRSAAEVFLDEAQRRPPPKIAPKVYDFAYRCWRQVAVESRSQEDYLKLAKAAEWLTKELPNHPRASEARWVSGLAMEEAEDYREALRRYHTIQPHAPYYWHARRNMARCRQHLYDKLPEIAPAVRHRNSARRAAEAWILFADDLTALKKKGSGSRIQPSRQQDAGRDKSKRQNPFSASSTPEAATSDRSPITDLALREQWIKEARLAAASILAGNHLRRFEDSLHLLDDLTPDSRVIGLRIRCLQGLGKIKEANRIIQDFLPKDSGGQVGAILIQMAETMELETSRLLKKGLRRDAKRLALDTVATLQQLLQWLGSQPEYADQIQTVQFRLAKALKQAGKTAEARQQIEALMTAYPDNGAYVRLAAVLAEEIAETVQGSNRRLAQKQAESLWAKLLRDSTLRETAPAAYWEARYHWLKLQLHHEDRAGDVLKGIETEQAWYPELGGPHWRRRLLELADQARAMDETSSP